MEGWSQTWQLGWHFSNISHIRDTAGNIYTAGNITHADVDPGPDIDDQEAEGGSYGDLFLGKFDPTGQYLWTKMWGGPHSDYASDIELDQDGNLILVGSFEESIDLDPGPGVEEHLSKGKSVVWLVRLDSDGNYLWGATWGGVRFDSALDLVLDDDGNFYVGGNIGDGGPVDLDPGPGMDEHVSNGQRDASLSKFNSLGEYQWGWTWGSYHGDYVPCVQIHNGTSILAAGTFTHSVDFDPGDDVDEFDSLGGMDLYMAVYNLDGEYQGVLIWDGLGGGAC